MIEVFGWVLLRKEEHEAIKDHEYWTGEEHGHIEGYDEGFEDGLEENEEGTEAELEKAFPHDGNVFDGK